MVYLDLYILNFPKFPGNSFVPHPSTFFKYLGEKVIFPKIWHIKIKIYHPTPVKPKYYKFYSNNKVSTHPLS